MQCCKNCIHARWQELTATGRIKRDTVGQCRVVPVVSNVPVCVEIRTTRRWVDPDDGKHCACYEENPGKPIAYDGAPVASYQEG